MPVSRSDDRAADAARLVRIEPGFLPHAEGSALIEMGGTHVICAASVQDRLPPWLRGQGRGWVTAEYGMLPRSTNERIDRRRAANSGRTREIERLIGRSLRAAVDLEELGEMAITVDCDVLRADGGTRTASVTGGYVALAMALRDLAAAGRISSAAVLNSVAAISVGIVDGEALLDLDYREDSRADVDLNVVMTGDGGFVEIQGTAEGKPFVQSQLDDLIALARSGCETMSQMQRDALEASRT